MLLTYDKHTLTDGTVIEYKPLTFLDIPYLIDLLRNLLGDCILTKTALKTSVKEQNLYIMNNLQKLADVEEGMIGIKLQTAICDTTFNMDCYKIFSRVYPIFRNDKYFKDLKEDAFMELLLFSVSLLKEYEVTEDFDIDKVTESLSDHKARLSDNK